MQLNVYLHNKDVKDYPDCLDTDDTPIQKQAGADYRIYRVINENSEGPPWVKALKHVIKPAFAEALTNRQCGVVAVFKIRADRETRFLSVCFGVGHMLLRKKTIEHNFGLLTTINSVMTLRRCSSRLLGTQTRQKSVLTNYDARVRELGFDFDEEILALASGKCRRNDLGTTISGTDSLKLSSRIAFEQIPTKLLDIYKRSKEKTYKTNGFDFIDQIEMIRDEDLIEKLDARLLTGFNKPGSAAIGVMAPMDANGEDEVFVYKVSGLGRPLWLSDVTLDQLRGYANGDVDMDTIDDTIRIQGFDSSGDSVTIKAPLRSYLACETTLKNGSTIENYVLANRKWYRVEADFMKKVKTQLQHGLSVYKGPPLKPWEQVSVKSRMIHDEGAYNQTYGAERDFLVLDKKKFTRKGYGRGNSIEVADLFHLPTKTLLCVKKNTRSSMLSHLFAQASVSAELFDEVEDYRTDFLADVRAKWPRDRTVTKDNIKTLNFAYIIGSETPPSRDTLAEGIHALPVFSRVNMRKHVKAIKALGHHVTLAYIPMI